MEDKGKAVETQNYNVEHLKLIQGVINRMANNSLSMKKIGISVFSLVLTFLISAEYEFDNFVLLLLGFIIIAFLTLDMYYLLQERKYRDLYSLVLEGTIEDFSMETQRKNFKDYLNCFRSHSVYPFYILPIVLSVIFVLMSYQK